jgi:hypothetical protein
MIFIHHMNAKWAAAGSSHWPRGIRWIPAVQAAAGGSGQVARLDGEVLKLERFFRQLGLGQELQTPQIVRERGLLIRKDDQAFEQILHALLGQKSGAGQNKNSSCKGIRKRPAFSTSALLISTMAKEHPVR